jgi:hypothetical protein
MSYCTIEEAWGNTQEFSTNQSHTPKRKKHKKKSKKTRETFDAPIDNFQNYDGVYDDNEDSLAETIPNNPDDHQRSFSRTLAPLPNHGQDISRVPEDIHFVDNLSPGNQYESVGSPYTQEVENTPLEYTPPPSSNNEMDWLKNNMSYLFERMESLSKKLDCVGSDEDSGSSEGSSTTDTLLFIGIGALTIFAVDVFFRAGQRSISR